jgi:tetratricopeptide (TPR) repeat protein
MGHGGSKQMKSRCILTKCRSLLAIVLAAAAVSLLVSCASNDLRLSNLSYQAAKHNQDKEYDQAIALYTRLIEEGYFLQGTYAQRGFAYEQKGDFQQALEDYTRAIEHGGTRISRAQLLEKMGDYEKAAADWSGVIQYENYPEYHYAWYGHRAMCYRKLRKYDQALSDFNKALELGPDQAWVPSLHLERAMVYSKLGDLNKALTDADTAAEVLANDPRIYAERGEIYRQLKQNQKALADFDRALELGSKHSLGFSEYRLQWAHAYRAALRIEEKEYEKALQDIDQAISMDPAFVFGYVQRGILFRTQGKQDAALKDLNRAIEIDDQYGLAYAERGELFRQSGDTKNALEDFGRAIELDIDAVQPYLYRARLYRDQNDHLKALADLNQALRSNPRSEMLYTERGRLYRQQGEFAAALADFSRALELDPANQEAADLWFEASTESRQSASSGGPRTPERGRGIELANMELYEIYPVFHKYYDDHPVGIATLINREKSTIGDIRLSFFVKQYMDSPKACPAPSKLAPGERRDADIMSLLNEKVLEVTEATKVAADITLEYRIEGEPYRDTRTVTIRILDRNAMTWDDDRKAAAFVTAKDPMVLTFSKGVVGSISDKGPAAINPNLLEALSLFSAMDLYGISYVVDPKTPFVEFSKNKTSVDYLQFPRQTLEYRAGDCDDLSILYAALLESVGIETAFITVPGHIYLAFSTGLRPKEARHSFSSMTNLIIWDDTVWVPVEVTERRGGFMKAWAEGAREWQMAESRDSAGFHPVHDAWREYEPVGLPGGGEITMPDRNAIVNAFQHEVTRFIDYEIAPRAAKLEQEIQRSGGTPEAHNKLGVLYAQYDKLDQAEAEFRKATAKKGYVPGLFNLGNVYFLQGIWRKAQEQYERALRLEPKNPLVLLALSRTYHETEQYDMARARYKELSAVDRKLAERFAYLGGAPYLEAGRAGRPEMLRRHVLWAE